MRRAQHAPSAAQAPTSQPLAPMRARLAQPTRTTRVRERRNYQRAFNVRPTRQLRAAQVRPARQAVNAIISSTSLRVSVLRALLEQYAQTASVL